MSIMQSFIGTNLTISAGGAPGTSVNVSGYTYDMAEGSFNYATVYYENYPLTTIYWQIANGSTTNTDWAELVTPSGSFNIEGSGNTQFNWAAGADLNTEGSEYYYLQVATTPGGTDILNEYLTIADTSLAAPPNGTLATSLYFDSTNDRLGYAANDDWVLGTSDFTIEWFQWHTQLPGSNYPRPFSVHHWSSSPISVELGNTGGLYWRNGANYAYTNPGSANLRGQWNHYAISRDYAAQRLSLWINGTRVMNIVDTANYGGAGQLLTIGHEDITQNGNFYGYITNFHWVKGTALYSPADSTITVPTAPITPVANTKLLLNVADEAGYIADSSGTSKIASVTTGFTWSPAGPF